MTPKGVLSAAMAPNGYTETAMHEVFCHPYTAGELVTQSNLGLLRVNGVRATAQVVDELGDGDFIVRIVEIDTPFGELVALEDWRVAA